MDKTKIKNFAVKARKQLVRSVRQSLANYGIDQDGVKKELSISTTTVKYYTNENFPLREKQIQWRQQILNRLNKEQEKDWKERLNEFIEEVAYTWFNQIIAIRFMEVNDYLPSHTRVLSSEEGRLEPDIITHSLEIEDYLGGYTNEEKELIKIALTSHKPDQMDNIFKILFIKQADMLSDLLPELFMKTSDYLKLLFTPKYHRGVVKELIDEIPEEYFDVSKSGQVSIIGWLYQYYNTDLKDKAFSKKKFSAEDIPAVTQLFTPDWIVKYLVQNSLGRYWIQILKFRGDVRTEEKIANDFNWEYYMSNEKETQGSMSPEVSNVEDIKFIDPAMGSGHILIYAFELFMQIYRSEGYGEQQAVSLIITKNLYGLDIDFRAYQLTYFAIMMKARKYDRRALYRKWHINIIAIPESYEFSYADYFKNSVVSIEQQESISKLTKLFKKGHEYGSAIKLPAGINVDDLINVINDNYMSIRGQLSIDSIDYFEKMNNLIDVLRAAQLLSYTYEVGVTNPPYMGLRMMDDTLKKFIKENYPENNQDLFSVFMKIMRTLVSRHGFIGMITQHSWMFLKTFQKARDDLNKKSTIINLAHLGTHAFGETGGEVVQTVAFILYNTSVENYEGIYERLVNEKSEKSKRDLYLECKHNRNCLSIFVKSQADFTKIPGSPIAYWVSKNVIDSFAGKKIKDVAETRLGMSTASNKQFVRYWYEVSFDNILINASSRKQAKQSKKRWFPYDKGGSFRKWYGNNELIVNWENDGNEIRNFKNEEGKIRSHNYNLDYIFCPGITWSALTSGNLSVRYTPVGHLFDNAGSKLFTNDVLGILGFLGSKVSNVFIDLLNPTLNIQPGTISELPYKEVKNEIKNTVKQCIDLSKKDWDNYELSYDFKNNMLIELGKNSGEHDLRKLSSMVLLSIKKNHNLLKEREEIINREFIKLYKFNKLDFNELDKDVSIIIPSCKEVIKQLLLYFIGCLFGRYSLNEGGLVYAGGTWNINSYRYFIPNEDNLVLLTDRDYFGDNRDIINRFKEFLVQAFDKDHLTENMQFIAEILDSKKIKSGISNEQVIRDYFLNDFYKDHDKIYKNRPIYWQFNSGRNNGFKALLYIHRYTTNELAMCRDYLHQLQEAYTNTIKLDKDQENNSESAREKNKYRKDAANLNKKLAEIIKYDEDLQHQALAQVEIDLDDGIIVNHAKVQGEKKIFSEL